MKCESDVCAAELPRHEVKQKSETFEPAEHYVCYDVPAGWLVSWVERDGKGRMVVLCPMHGAGTR